MRLEFRHLELLVAMEDTGELAAAARRLDITTTNLTRQLRRIEEHLGHPVFERRPGRLTPTAAGLEDLALAREALRAVDGIAAGRPRPSTVRLLYYRTPMPEVMADLRRAHPDVAVTLEVASPEDGHRLVAAGKADVFVGCVLPHVRWPARQELVESHVTADPTVVLLGPAHRQAAAAVVDLATLADDDWITVPDPDARHSLGQECRVIGGFEPRITYEVVDSRQVGSLVGAGLGVMFGSSPAPADGGYLALPYRGSTPSRLAAVHDPRRCDPALVTTITTLIRQRFDPPPG